MYTSGPRRYQECTIFISLKLQTVGWVNSLWYTYSAGHCSTLKMNEQGRQRRVLFYDSLRVMFDKWQKEYGDIRGVFTSGGSVVWCLRAAGGVLLLNLVDFMVCSFHKNLSSSALVMCAFEMNISDTTFVCFKETAVLLS